MEKLKKFLSDCNFDLDKSERKFSNEETRLNIQFNWNSGTGKIIVFDPEVTKSIHFYFIIDEIDIVEPDNE